MHSTHLAISKTLTGFCSLLQILIFVYVHSSVTVMYMVPACSIWGAAIKTQQTIMTQQTSIMTQQTAIMTQQTGYMLLCGVQALLDDNTFCGLALDEDNQDDLSADRIKTWVAQISKEMKA